jgi:hypothetical protein
MSAGSGLKHEEYNIGEEEVNFLQIWILPKLQNILPRYQLRHFPKENRKNKLTTIVSGEEGPEHCWINQNAKLSLGYFDKDQQTEYFFRPVNMCIFIFVIKGSMDVNGKIVLLKDAIGIWDTDKITLQCREDSEFLLIETPINQK